MEPAVSAEFSWLQAALVFIAALAVDFAWTKYITASAAKLPHTAAFWSMSIILLGAFSVVSYTQNPWMLVPVALGAYASTYLAVWREKRTQTTTSPAS